MFSVGSKKAGSAALRLAAQRLQQNTRSVDAAFTRLQAASGAQAQQKRQVWTQDLALGLNVNAFYQEAAAPLEAATESVFAHGQLAEDQPRKLESTRAWVAFGHHNGEYMNTPREELVFGQKTPADGDPPYAQVVRDVMESAKANNGVVYASTAGWNAMTHFGELATMARDKGEDYLEVAESLPFNTMVSYDSVDLDKMANIMIGIDDDSDEDEARPKDYETWGLSQKPSITTIEFVHLFEGPGRSDAARISVLDGQGAPLDKNKFLALYDRAANEVRKTPNGVHTYAAKKAIADLQAYVDKGEAAPISRQLGSKLTDMSPYFGVWANAGPPAYQRNFTQAMAKLDNYYQNVAPGEAVCFTLEVPEAYGPVSHIMGGMIIKPQDGGDPEVHLAHHESAPVDPKLARDRDARPDQQVGWKDGAMTNIMGIPTDNHDTRAFFGAPSMNIMDTPLLKSLAKAGTPNWTIFVSGTPEPVLERLKAETGKTEAGERSFYSPRDTEHGPANTCVSQMARLFANEDASLRSVDGDPIDVDRVTTHAVPELAQSLHEIGLTAVGAGFLEGRPGEKGPWKASEEALKGGAGLMQFGEVGSTWGAGNTPAVVEGMTTPIDARPNAPRQPHHIGVKLENFTFPKDV